MDLGNLYSSAYEDYKTASTYYEKAIEAFDTIKDIVSLSKAYFNVIVNALNNDDYKEMETYLSIL